MAKTQEELNAIKEDVETLNNKLTELTEEDLEQVTGGLALHDKLVARAVAPDILEVVQATLLE